jgi:hypothetical protein
MALHLSGICVRRSRNRTKRDNDTRSKDQDFTHHLAPLVVSALFAVEITTQARIEFTGKSLAAGCWAAPSIDARFSAAAAIVERLVWVNAYEPLPRLDSCK